MNFKFGDTRLSRRFWSKVRLTADPTGCWIWIANKTAATKSSTGGYGMYWVRALGKKIGAHRVAYHALVGPIPQGMEIDHVRALGCTSRACVNPAHLGVVTHHENFVRGDRPAAFADGAERQRAKTHCPKGHPYDEINTYVYAGSRTCRACGRESAARRRKEQGEWIAYQERLRRTRTPEALEAYRAKHREYDRKRRGRKKPEP